MEAVCKFAKRTLAWFELLLCGHRNYASFLRIALCRSHSSPQTAQSSLVPRLVRHGFLHLKLWCKTLETIKAMLNHSDKGPY